uniref:Putative secreted protein n=1 Tax=Anopheles triannulatus TaxID=58253 RepID=A0A2M4B6B8_9DIPT
MQTPLSKLLLWSHLVTTDYWDYYFYFHFVLQPTLTLLRNDQFSADFLITNGCCALHVHSPQVLQSCNCHWVVRTLQCMGLCGAQFTALQCKTTMC